MYVAPSDAHTSTSLKCRAQCAHVSMSQFTKGAAKVMGERMKEIEELFSSSSRVVGVADQVWSLVLAF